MGEPRKGLVERLFAEHRRALQTFFYRRIRTKSDAPDLAQEVYVRMLRVNDIDAIRNPERYLYTVASNLVKEYAVLDVGRPAAWTLMIDAHVFVVGTQFDVYRNPDVTTVTVVEGSVAVLAGQPPPGVTGLPLDALRVNAGYQVRVDARGVLAQPTPVDVQQAVAWLQRQDSF